MLIADTRASIPLISTLMDWNPDNIQKPDNLTAIIPIFDDVVKKAVENLAYEIAANQPWVWPDLNRTTVALVADMGKYSFVRYSLMVGVKPSEATDDETGEDWAVFETERREAITENGGATTYDSFSVMLTEGEAQAVQARLFDVLGMY